MEAQLIRKSKGEWFVEHLHFVIGVNDKEIPLVTITLDTSYSGEQELGGFGFELCACSPDEVQAVLRCYSNHARFLEIYFRACHQMHISVNANELTDLLNWGFLSEREIKEVTHAFNMETDSQYRIKVEGSNLQQKRVKKDAEKRQRENRSIYLYLMRDSATNHIKIGHSRNPSQRESTLFAEKPSMVLIGAWLATAPEEKKLHEEFADKRKRGEWFALTDDDIENIKARFAVREQWNLG
jgi:hypothetical protein